MKVRSISRKTSRSAASASLISGISCVASFPFLRMRSTQVRRGRWKQRRAGRRQLRRRPPGQGASGRVLRVGRLQRLRLRRQGVLQFHHARLQHQHVQRPGHGRDPSRLGHQWERRSDCGGGALPGRRIVVHAFRPEVEGPPEACSPSSRPPSVGLDADLHLELQGPGSRHPASRPHGPDLLPCIRSGQSKRYIDTVDAEGVALAGIKALYARLMNQRERLTVQRAQLGSLRAEVMAQGRQLARLQREVNLLLARAGHRA